MAYYSATVVAGKLFDMHANEIPSDGHSVCDKCNKQFPDVESLYQHKAKDHGSLKLPLNLKII
jgi:hypothetical protein